MAVYQPVSTQSVVSDNKKLVLAMYEWEK